MLSMALEWRVAERSLIENSLFLNSSTHVVIILRFAKSLSCDKVPLNVFAISFVSLLLRLPEPHLFDYKWSFKCLNASRFKNAD